MQELVFIGQGMDRAGIEAALRGCELTDEELALGPEGWATMADPFGDWEVVEDPEEVLA
jgi:hypothetical protein